MKLQVKKLDPTAIIPTRGSVKASGLDLYALEDTEILPGETKIVKTGVAFGIPEGFEIQVRPRSGLSLKTPLRVANTPGTVDADYTGECCVIMTNTAPEADHNKLCDYDTPVNANTQLIKRGDRIAQAVLCPVTIPELEEVEELGQTDRGTGGFGSTGK
jgi:dUTP pyrophosphatase